MSNQKIVTIGGGAGSFMVLSGLKKRPVDLTAVVSMSDDSGSTGILRDELGVLPPGDVRQCLVALSQSSQVLRDLFNYRYASGGLSGHSFGNIFLSTLEKVTGGLDLAISEAGRILRIKGRVLPVTLGNTRLVATLKDGREIIGEGKIYANAADLSKLKKLSLRPAVSVNPEIIEAIKQADKIIINPGDLYVSLIPNFLVQGLSQAIAKAQAKVIYVGNLMTKPGQTDGYSLVDYLLEIEKYLGQGIIDYAIYNKERPSDQLLKKYARQGETVVLPGDFSKLRGIKLLSYNLLSHKVSHAKKSDNLANFRSLIRHDSDKLAEVIYKL
ncbi:MAG: YvcK family protein [Patescibacteria group bacterium]|nr:YvcK family protein [Patescibacteria group bacterium]